MPKRKKQYKKKKDSRTHKKQILVNENNNNLVETESVSDEGPQEVVVLDGTLCQVDEAKDPMTLDQLPKKILKNILGRLQSRRYVAQVCDSFYQVVCEMEAGDYRLKLDHTSESDLRDIFMSIIASSRRINEIVVSNLNFVKSPNKFGVLLNIFEKYSATLKIVTFTDSILHDAQIFDFMRFWGNVEELSVTTCRIYRCHAAREVESKLVKLKKLDLSNTTSFARPGTAPTHNMLEVVLASIVNLSPLKDFSAHVGFASSFPYKKVQLLNLAINRATPRDMRLTTQLQCQPYLRSLDLLSCYIMDDVVTVICKMEFLKTLKINVSGISAKAFMSLKQLELSEIHIATKKTAWILTVFTGITFNSLHTIYLNFEELSLQPSTWKHLLQSFSHVKKLHIVTNTVRIIDFIFETRYLSKSLDILTIELKNTDLAAPNVKFCPKVSTSCPGMTQLTIINHGVKLSSTGRFGSLKQFPGLRSLKISGFEVTESLFQDALRDHRLLQKLEISELKPNTSKYIFNDTMLEMLFVFGFMLKTLKVDCLACTLTEEFFRDQFPICEHRGGTQILKYR